MVKLESKLEVLGIFLFKKKMYWVKKTSKIQKILNLENYQIISVLKLEKNENLSI